MLERDMYGILAGHARAREPLFSMPTFARAHTHLLLSYNTVNIIACVISIYVYMLTRAIYIGKIKK